MLQRSSINRNASASARRKRGDWQVLLDLPTDVTESKRSGLPKRHRLQHRGQRLHDDGGWQFAQVLVSEMPVMSVQQNTVTYGAAVRPARE